jgi:uncharacterized membrane protein (UPF0182 family)
MSQASGDEVSAGLPAARRPARRRRRILGARRRAAVVVVGLASPVLVAVLGSWLLTDYWWFREVGQVDVLWRELELRAALLAGVGGAASVCLLADLRAAARRVRMDMSRGLLSAGAAVCLVLGCPVGLWAERRWQVVMLWMHRSQLGVTDPVHHLDVGFFVFTLPLLEASADVMLAVVVLAGVLAVVVYALSGAVSRAPLRVSGAARPHLAVLGAAVLVSVALRLELVTYSLEVSRVAPSGLTALPGADFVDVRVRILALQLLGVLLVLCAGAVLASAWLAAAGRRRAAAHVAAWPTMVTVCIAFTSLLVVPWLIQRLVVDPQPVASERPELRGAIDATTYAFSLADVRAAPRAVRPRLPAAKAVGVAGLANVQVWDRSVLVQQMRQLASSTPYFRVRSSSLDVQDAGGKQPLIVLAEQELDLRRVPDHGAAWADAHMVYTHGLGSLSYSASRVGSDGQPVALRPAAPLSQPRIYFGNQVRGAPAWVVADTRRAEADGPIPAGQLPGSYHYTGRGGIELTSWIRRAAFAIRLHDLGLLISSDITPRSRLIIQRDVISRLTALAGFIQWDRATTTAVANGHIMFVAYGYTTSSDYPQAEPVRLAGHWVNYARASVVATVDAFSGAIHVYLLDNAGAVARAWAAAFPGLFQQTSAFPAVLRPELRYPPALFDAQARLEQQFHTTSPAVFASGSDVWDRPTSLSGSVGAAGEIRFGMPATQNPEQLPPDYRFAEPSGGGVAATLLRTTIFTPRGGQNVVAELDGWVGHDGQLQLSLAALPAGQVVPGPAQISRLVLITPDVASALDLVNKETTDLDQHSVSTVTLGTPRWQLVAGSVVQVQPVYLEAGGSGVARMLGITVFADGRAAIDRTTGRALRRAVSP